MTKNLEKIIIGGVIAAIAVIVLAQSCTVVHQRERGVLYTFGVANHVVEPGLVFKAPFAQSIKKYSIAPKTYEVTFPVGQDGAITRDMQTVGTTVNVKYSFDDQKIMDIAMFYGDSVVESAMKSNIKASVKETVGTYSIYDLVERQSEVTEKVASAILGRMSAYPIKISQTTITNWDWSDDFDRQIKETANRTQQVKQAEQEANIAEAKAQIKVREANANLEAEAKKIAADAQAYENQRIAQNLNVMQAQWNYEIQKLKYEKWNGKEVSDQAVYVPNTYDLKKQ